MSAAEILEALRRMPEAERRELVERIEDEFAAADAELTPEQIAQFEERADRLRRNPETGIPWEQVRTELNERLEARRPCPAE